MDTKQQMDKEEETQLEASKETDAPEVANITTQENKTAQGKEEESKDIIPDSEESLAKAEEQEIAETGTDIDVTVKEPMKEVSNSKEAESPHPLNPTNENAETVAEQTTKLLKDEPGDQSDVAPDSASLLLETGVTSATVNQTPEKEEEEEEEEEEGEAKETEQVKEVPLQAELPDLSVTATTVSESHAEDKHVELVKEDIKETELPDAIPLVVSDIREIAETTEETKTAEPCHEADKKVPELIIHATPATETVNESADLKPEAKLPQVQTAEPQFPGTKDAAANGEEENKETELVKEDIKEFEFPESSLTVTAVADAESIPETKISEALEVSEVHTEKEKASDDIKVENTDASPLLAKGAVSEVHTKNASPLLFEAEREVSEALPEKKKKRALGDHLAEEKVNDSVNSNKQASVEESEAELSKEDQTASAVEPKESTDISSRDVNISGDTNIEADEKKEENDKVAENAAGEVTATEAAHEREGEADAKEEVASKPTSRSSNSILSKVKHQIVKVKKAIVKRSPSSKNMPVENKNDIKVK